MKGFVLDENLPARVRFRSSYPIFHSRDIGGKVSDSTLWEYARTRDLVIVSKDADFSERMLIAEPPPRVVHLRFGNLSRSEFHAFLAKVWPRIEILLESNKLINDYRDAIEVVFLIHQKFLNNTLALPAAFDNLSPLRLVAAGLSVPSPQAAAPHLRVKS